MSTETSAELFAYHEFVKLTLSKGGTIDEDATPQAFIEHQQQLNRLRAALQPAADRFHSHVPGSEVDIDRLTDDVLGKSSQAGH
jgi:hypothetical protein